MKEEKNSKDQKRHEQPLDVLTTLADKDIFIRLMDRTEIIGRLLDFDQYMNLKVDLEGEEVLIRGNNVVLIATNWEDIHGEAAGSG